MRNADAVAFSLLRLIQKMAPLPSRRSTPTPRSGLTRVVGESKGPPVWLRVVATLRAVRRPSRGRNCSRGCCAARGPVKEDRDSIRTPTKSGEALIAIHVVGASDAPKLPTLGRTQGCAPDPRLVDTFSSRSSGWPIFDRRPPEHPRTLPSFTFGLSTAMWSLPPVCPWCGPGSLSAGAKEAMRKTREREIVVRLK